MLMPDDNTMREMLKAGCNTWVANVLGIDRSALRQERLRLGMRSFAVGGSPSGRRQQERRWYHQWVPALVSGGVITGERAKRLLAEVGPLPAPEPPTKTVVPPEPPPQSPPPQVNRRTGLTAGAVLVALRKVCETLGRCPTRKEFIDNMATNQRERDLVYDRVRALIHMHEVEELPGGLLRPVLSMPEASPIKTYRMDPDEIARRYGPPGSTRPLEVSDQMVARIWPQAEELLAEVEAIKQAGEPVVKTLVARYNSTEAGVYYALSQARAKVNKTKARASAAAVQPPIDPGEPTQDVQGARVASDNAPLTGSEGGSIPLAPVEAHSEAQTDSDPPYRRHDLDVCECGHQRYLHGHKGSCKGCELWPKPLTDPCTYFCLSKRYDPSAATENPEGRVPTLADREAIFTEGPGLAEETNEQAATPPTEPAGESLLEVARRMTEVSAAVREWRQPPVARMPLPSSFTLQEVVTALASVTEDDRLLGSVVRRLLDGKGAA